MEGEAVGKIYCFMVILYSGKETSVFGSCEPRSLALWGARLVAQSVFMKLETVKTSEAIEVTKRWSILAVICSFLF